MPTAERRSASDSGCARKTSKSETRGGGVTITIALVIVAVVALAVVELRMFWVLGERGDQRRRAPRQPGSVEPGHPNVPMQERSP